MGPIIARCCAGWSSKIQTRGMCVSIQVNSLRYRTNIACPVLCYCCFSCYPCPKFLKQIYRECTIRCQSTLQTLYVQHCHFIGYKTFRNLAGKQWPIYTFGPLTKKNNMCDHSCLCHFVLRVIEASLNLQDRQNTHRTELVKYFRPEFARMSYNPPAYFFLLLW